MKYYVQYFYDKKRNRCWKDYKNINEACVEEDKIMQRKENLRWILIESKSNKKTWRMILNQNLLNN